MGTPFLGELRIVSFNYPPVGWALANGQFLPINQNQALFSLFGTMYGGNGQTTLALPNLRGRVPIHVGAGFIQGQAGGEEAHTLTQSELPAHTHIAMGTNNNATQPGPNPNAGSNAYARAGNQMYGTVGNLVAMSPLVVGNVGGSQPHQNQQPYLVLNYIVALQGIFPSRN
jgi:microcystin-dependent protein